MKERRLSVALKTRPDGLASLEIFGEKNTLLVSLTLRVADESKTNAIAASLILEALRAAKETDAPE